MKVLFTILFAFIFLASSGQAGKARLFSFLTPAETGISFKNEIKENEAENVLAYEYFYNGGGVATGDINNDGLIDIFLTANLKSCKLYLNLGNCHFKDITRQAGVGGRDGWKTGVTMADVNGDGLLDIYLCYSGKGSPASRRNELYINKGNLQFAEMGRKYGVDDMGCSTQGIFFDYDIDGDLDLYVLNHNIKAFKNVGVQHLKNDYDSLAADRLYRNDNGQFTDVSKQAGISGNPISFGLGVAVSDINNDGWPDIYVSNDYNEHDYLYINNANGTFKEQSLYMLSHLSQFSMGSDVADINNDGLVDIFTLDMLPEDNRRQKLLQSQENYELYEEMARNGFHYQFMRNMLHLNNGNGTFSEIGQLAGISNTDWSWSALLADYDNDGFKDCYITNGYLRDYTNRDFLKFWGNYLVKQTVKKDSIRYLDIVEMMPSTMTKNYSFRNNGNLGFTNTSADWGVDQLLMSNGAAFADLDNDGDLDLVVNNINANASLYRNETKLHHYLEVKLKGSGMNTQGIGTKLFCYAGGHMQLLEQQPTRGYQSAVSPLLHFGVGNAAQVDSLKIIWLNGRTQTLYNIPVNQVLTVDQQQAKDNFMYPRTMPPSKFTQVRPMLDFEHAQPDYIDFKRQPLMPVMFSPCGPQMAKGDLNGDGLEDIFIGSTQGQPGILYLQQIDGQFSPTVFNGDEYCTTSDVLLFDANGDGHKDIYCVSGGYNDYEINDARLQDRLFINDGKANFKLSVLPEMRVSKSCVAAADIDKDGDMDLFVGGRVIPGQYPDIPQSFLLINDGTGRFTDSTPSPIRYAGLITDAEWIDLNKDGFPELVLIGEWMPPKVFDYRKKEFINKELEAFSGWWNTMELMDIDNDGDKDIIAGNWGLNSQMRASAKEPASISYADIDNNGSVDPFISYYIQGTSYPYVSRDELLDQVYSMRSRFTDYKSYAEATMDNLFATSGTYAAPRMQSMMASTLETIIFENKEGKFVPLSLPVQAQFSPIYKIVVQDINNDSLPDLLLLGNTDYVRLKMGKIDADFGILLLNEGNGNFRYCPQRESGLRIIGDVKDALWLKTKNVSYLIAAANGMPLQWYKLN